VTDAHAIVVGTWGIAGTEWRRTHLRLLLKRGGRSYVDMIVLIPDELLNTGRSGSPEGRVRTKHHWSADSSNCGRALCSARSELGTCKLHIDQKEGGPISVQQSARLSLYCPT
jgi:hypothetical protein